MTSTTLSMTSILLSITAKIAEYDFKKCQSDYQNEDPDPGA